MHEHQTRGQVNSGSQDPYVRGTGGYELQGEDTFADRPHRRLTPRDETTRAGQHHYAWSTGRAAARSNNMLPILAMGAGGTLLFGWLLTRLRPSTQNQHRRQQSHYSPNRGWREHDAFSGSSEYASWRNRSVATDETRDLIASDKVEGTAVYDRNGERLGSVHNFMVGKRSGQVAYAVLSFGGWLGLGESYHPLPWNALTYDTELGGYVVNLDKDRLRNAPSHRAGHDTSSDASYWQRVRDYWT